MADYVLVHGAWGGGDAFDRLKGELIAAGHRVMVAQLTGLGTRRSEISPAIDLSCHIGDVVEQIATSGFDRFILAGHSYGGMVVTGVATKLGARIDAIVYIDAFLPGDDQALWDIVGPFEKVYYIEAQKDAPGLVLPFPPARGNPRYSRHPLLTLTEPVHFSGEEAKIARRSYIYATGYSPTPFTRFRDTVAGEASWELHLSDSGHDVMKDQPEQLLGIMLGLAS